MAEEIEPEMSVGSSYLAYFWIMPSSTSFTSHPLPEMHSISYVFVMFHHRRLQELTELSPAPLPPPNLIYSPCLFSRFGADIRLGGHIDKLFANIDT
eukprot:3720261-Amphidinium_carterae.1